MLVEVIGNEKTKNVKEKKDQDFGLRRLCNSEGECLSANQSF